jgi:phage-related protein
MDSDLWAVRISLEGRIARVLFTLDEHAMVLLHGFIKKSQATPKEDLKTAMSRKKKLRSK